MNSYGKCTVKARLGLRRLEFIPPRLRIPSGPGADSEEKHEPTSDIDTVAWWEY